MRTVSRIFFISLILVGCSTNKNETSDIDSVNNKNEEEVDGPGDDSMAQSVDNLIIKGKEIWVRDFPNTGKVVMKLNEGDVCKILQVGRYDVIREKGSHWHQIEFNGKSGWVFGSQTDKEAEEWVEPSASGNSTYSLNKLQATDSIELFQLVGKEIKKTEMKAAGSTDDVEGESKEVEVKTNSITANWSSGEGAVVNEEFKKAKSKDMLQLWDYSYMRGAASMYAGNYTIVITQKDSKCSIVSDLPGKAIEIISLRNGKYLIVSQYELFDMGTSQVGFINSATYDPSSNSIVHQQRLGYCRAPKFNPSPDSYYAEKVDFELKNDEKLGLIIKENFTFLGPDLSIQRKGTSKRYYQFNEMKNQFEEFQNEEIKNEAISEQ